MTFDIFTIGEQIIGAYFQIIIMLVGFVFTLFGGAAFLSSFQIKTKKRVWLNATIIEWRKGDGVIREDGGHSAAYFPVYEAIDHHGERIKYYSQSGTGNYNKYPIGSRCRISPIDDSPGFAHREGDEKAEVIIGIGLSFIGLLLVSLSLYFIPFSQLTLPIWAAVTLYALLKFGKSIKPKHLRETMEGFRQRKNKEALTKYDAMPVYDQNKIKAENKRLEPIGLAMNKVSLIVGFGLLALGGMGYNAQLEFIDTQSHYEETSPCKELPLGQDCRKTVPLIDLISALPADERPTMLGIYRGNSDPEKIVVNYGPYTPAPYFILMALGALIIFGAIRSHKKTL